MRKILVIASLLLSIQNLNAQRNDQELKRDSVVGWNYVTNPVKPNAVYKPIKSEYANGATYSVWQQQAVDVLINWIQQSYLPRGLVMRRIDKNDQRYYLHLNGPLHTYGANFSGFTANFVNGKINLHCCEQGQRLLAGFNNFPGAYLKGFNPGGLRYFAERATFSSGYSDAELAAEGVDKKIQPNVYPYRTYLSHYHDNGKPFNKIGIVIPKDGVWPFKPVLVKDAIALYRQQLAAYPAIIKDDLGGDYTKNEINTAIERLKPYYNEPAKILNRSILSDDKGHSTLSPTDIINGMSVSKTFPEYFMLVSTTQQTIDLSKKDAPLWVYFDLSPSIDLAGNLSKYDTRFGTGTDHMVYSLVNNLNFEYISKWLVAPERMKDIAYTPAKAPAKSSGNNITASVSVSATAAAKNKDPLTILFEDFEGYDVGPLSAFGWHTYGRGGHVFENATVSAINGQRGKWISLPYNYTFYPDYTKPLPAAFTVNYDVLFGSGIKNTRAAFFFKIDTKSKTSTPIETNDDKFGFQFSIAMSGETETEIRFYQVEYDGKYTRVRLPAYKTGDVVRITVSVNGASVAVSADGKELMRNDKALPAGYTFKRYGWFTQDPAMHLGNIYIKSGMPAK